MDWSQCFTCQSHESTSAIVSPFKSPAFLENPEKSSYYKVADGIKKFQTHTNVLPSALHKVVWRYGSDEILASDFVSNKAIFHKTCMTKYDAFKFERHMQRNSSNIEPAEEAETPRLSRSITCAKHFTEGCFFCDKVEGASALHMCRTLY